MYYCRRRRVPYTYADCYAYSYGHGNGYADGNSYSDIHTNAYRYRCA